MHPHVRAVVWTLARILEVLATQLPETFLRGSSISLTRLLEVRHSLSVLIQLNHCTESCSLSVAESRVNPLPASGVLLCER